LQHVVGTVETNPPVLATTILRSLYELSCVTGLSEGLKEDPDCSSFVTTSEVKRPRALNLIAAVSINT
jgi:hypothetical protein